jgi:hypothetical protein
MCGLLYNCSAHLPALGSSIAVMNKQHIGCAVCPPDGHACAWLVCRVSPGDAVCNATLLLLLLLLQCRRGWSWQVLHCRCGGGFLEQQRQAGSRHSIHRCVQSAPADGCRACCVNGGNRTARAVTPLQVHVVLPHRAGAPKLGWDPADALF